MSKKKRGSNFTVWGGIVVVFRKIVVKKIFD